MYITKNKTISAWTWSIPAGPQSCMGFDLTPNSNCSICYASQGMHVFPQTMAAFQRRYQWWMDTEREERIATIVKEIGKKKFFRIFSSGDFYRIEDIEDWTEICRRCPNTKFWVSTSAWRTKRDNHTVMNRLAIMRELENVNVRLSIGSIDNYPIPEELKWSRWTFSGITTQGKGCPKQIHGSCALASCRACWDQSEETVTYKMHGNKINWKKRLSRLAEFPVQDPTEINLMKEPATRALETMEV